MMSIATDLGIRMGGEVWGDASAALGIIKRRGLGQTPHIDTGLLWIQNLAAEKHSRFGKVLGRDNPADLCTKHIDWDTIARHSESVSATFEDGRATPARKLTMLKAIWEVEVDDDKEPIMEVTNCMTKSSTTQYEPDDLGLLQPVLSRLCLPGCTASTSARGIRTARIAQSRGLGAVAQDTNIASRRARSANSVRPNELGATRTHAPQRCHKTSAERRPECPHMPTHATRYERRVSHQEQFDIPQECHDKSATSWPKKVPTRDLKSKLDTPDSENHDMPDGENPECQKAKTMTCLRAESMTSNYVPLRLRDRSDSPFNQTETISHAARGTRSTSVPPKELGAIGNTPLHRQFCDPTITRRTTTHNYDKGQTDAVVTVRG